MEFQSFFVSYRRAYILRELEYNTFSIAVKVNETKEKWITFHFGVKYDKYNKIRGYFKKKSSKIIQ